MEEHIAKLGKLSDRASDNSTAWDTLGLDGKPPDSEAYNRPPATPWSTTNSEYGRHNHPAFRKRDALASSMNTCRGVVDTQDSPQLNPDDVEPNETSRFQQKDTYRALPDYWPVHNSAPAPLPEPPTELRRMTTGYARQYMTQECPRFWTNVKSVAHDAGLEIRSTTPQVLSVDHSNDMVSDTYGEYSYQLPPSPEENEPWSTSMESG